MNWIADSWASATTDIGQPDTAAPRPWVPRVPATSTGHTGTGLHLTLGDVARTADAGLAIRLMSLAVPRTGQTGSGTYKPPLTPDSPTILCPARAMPMRQHSISAHATQRTHPSMRKVRLRIRSPHTPHTGHSGTGMRRSDLHPRPSLGRTRNNICVSHIRPPHSQTSQPNP